MSACAKCHAAPPRFPYAAARWCAKCYGLPSDPLATGGSRFTVESKTNWKGGRVGKAPANEREYDFRDGEVSDP